MANFNTHLSIALAVSSGIATCGAMMGFYGFFELIVFALVGMIGGLLPDIDLDHSKITQMGFGFASVFGASFLMILYIKSQKPSPTDALIIWGLLVLVLRFLVFGLFSRITRHRGAVHSVPCMAFASLLFVILCYDVLHFGEKFSWLCGLFLFLGTLIHLVLDEIYSINIYGLKVKKSFGTAFKFFETKKPLTYILLYVFLAGSFVLSPPKVAMIEMLLPLIQKL